MTGTALTAPGTVKNGAIVLSAESRTRLNSLGEAWSDIQFQIATYSPARDDTWAEKVIKDLSGAKLDIEKVTQGYQPVAQAYQQAELKRQAMEAFVATTLARIESIALEAPQDASAILTVWMNRLASRVADLADQATRLTAAHDTMFKKVAEFQSDKGSAEAVADRLQKGIEQLQALIASVNGEKETPGDVAKAATANQLTEKELRAEIKKEVKDEISEAMEKLPTAVTKEINKIVPRSVRGQWTKNRNAKNSKRGKKK